VTGGRKPVEMELKLVLPGPEAEAATIEKMTEQGYRIKELKPVTNVDLYLDTFDWLLMKRKMSLRYRFSDGKAMYTIKSLGPIEGGIARRLEIETLLDGPVDVPVNIPVKQIRSSIEEVIFPRKLLEQIQIRTDRRRYRVISPERAKFELAFDTAGFLLKGFNKPRGARKLHELEAELLAGPPAALNALSALLSATLGYPPSQVSKFELAVERFKIVVPSKRPPDKFLVRPDDRLDLAVRKIMTHQLNRFREQIPGIRQDIDTEFVHQARVTTRRLRSSLRLFRAAVPQTTGEFLAGELKWLGGLLGAVRDLDVFLLNLSRFREQVKSFPGKQKKYFANWIGEHRRGPLANLIQALDSPRYKNFEQRLNRFLQGPLPRSPRAPLALKQVSEVAPELITEKFAAVIKQGHAVLADPKIKQFHALRIQMKKLRYACEFLAPAYSGGLDPFIERTVEIQDCLGDIQDTVFTSNFIESLLEDWKRRIVDPDLLFVLGELYQLQGEIAAERRQRFGAIWGRFSSQETTRELKEITAGSPPPKEKGTVASGRDENNLKDS